MCICVCVCVCVYGGWEGSRCTSHTYVRSCDYLVQISHAFLEKKYVFGVLINYVVRAVALTTSLWRVCVVDGWFTASPGLSQTDWTLAGWGCTPGVHEQSWHPRINQPSTHTLEEERESWPVYHQLGEYHQPVNSNKHLLYYIYPCPVSEEPKESHFGGVWRSYPATVTFFVALIGCSAILLRAEGTWKTTVYPAYTANGAAPDPTSFWCGSGLPG